MDKNQFELKSLVSFVLICYVANLIFSIAGVASVPRSTLQLLLYQLSSAFAILVYVTVRIGGEYYSWPLNFA